MTANSKISAGTIICNVMLTREHKRDGNSDVRVVGDEAKH
jgi:hypothetical protein